MTEQDAKSSSVNSPSPKGGNNDKPKPPRDKPKKPTTEKFKGATSDLNGKIITADATASTAQQFKELHKQLKVYASANYSADVGSSLYNLVDMTMKDFKPEALDPSLWTTYKENEDGTPELDSDGKQIPVIDEAEKTVLEDMYKQEIKDCSRTFTQHKKDMKAMFAITIGQTDESIQSSLAAMSGYKQVEKTNDTIGLLKLLRELCYRDTKTDVHCHTSIIRAHRKLLCSRQRDEDGATYVKNVVQRHEVLKAMKGSILCDEVINATLATQDPPITRSTFDTLSAAKQLELENKAEQQFLAALIVEGSNAETSHLRQTLGQQFALGSDRYPRDTVQARKMLNEFAGTIPKKRNTNTKTGTAKSNKPTVPKQGATLVTQAATPQRTEFEQNGRQLLLAALETEEDFNNDGLCFVQAVFPDDENRSVSSDSTDADWNYWADHGDDPSIALNGDVINTASTITTVATAASLLDRSVAFSTVTSPSKAYTPLETLETSENKSSSSKDDPLVVVGLDIETHNHQTELNEYRSPYMSNSTITTVSTKQCNDDGPVVKPDPPGSRYDTVNYRSGKVNASANYRSGNKIISAERRSGGNTKRDLGVNNIRALDLAVTPSQKQSFGGGNTTYTYPEKVQHMFAQATLRGSGIDANWILLDSESSVHLVVNKDLLDNIRLAPNGESMQVHCNAGTARTRHIGDLRGFGTVWYYKHGIANILSLGLISDQYRVTMDTDVDNAMYVHKQNGDTRRFHRGTYDLYYYDVRENHGTVLAGVSTVEENKKAHSALDCKRAERAQRMQEIIGFPSDQEYLQMIDNKVIHNCTVSRRDIQLARKIFGKNTSIIQGKSVRQQPKHVCEDSSQVPQSILTTYGVVTISCDIIYVNKIRFFVTISRHINFRTVRAISNARVSTLMESIKSVIGLYKSRGFTVKYVFADNQFECLRNKLLLLTPPVELNTTARDEHDPFIERSNRTVKERVRCGFNSTPFKAMPMRMTVELVYWSVFWLNVPIPKGGVSQTLSPREIMTGHALDATKHARFQFGEYIQAHNDETDNGMDARAVDAIYLRPTGNIQGGFYALDLNTGRRINRRRGTPIPMTETVIKRVEFFASKQKSPNGLIFADSRNRSTILDLDTTVNNDDDDASDASYHSVNNDDYDNRSTHTDLSGVTNVTEVDGNINEERLEPPGQPEIPDDDPEQQQGEELRQDNEHAEVANNVSDDEEVEIRFEYPDDTDDDGPTLDDRAGDEMVQHIEDTAEVEETGSLVDDRDDDVPRELEGTQAEADSEETTEPYSQRLRPTVQRGHNRYTADEGYVPTTHTRRVLFTAGMSAATRKIEDDEKKHKGVAAAIHEYNNIDATLATKQYGVRKGLKVFGDEGVEAVLKELQQFHDRSVVVPMDPAKMTKEMRDQALPYLMFLKRKRCGKVKGRGCADGRRQREFISKEEASSPTVSLYALIISSLIDAIEGRDVATADIPGAFLQTDMPEDEDVYIRLDGTMAELLCKLDPKLYSPHIVGKGKSKVLYAKAKKAIYGTLRAALLFWENLSGKLTEWGFEANAYDACTMNKMINNHQCTICWHVDDLKISHKDPAVVTDVLKTLNEHYGKISPLTITRGKVHDYVGMTIDYSEDGKVKFSMFDYLEEIIQNLPEEFKGEAQTPAGDHLFTIDEDSEKLDEAKADMFHHYVAKLLFMAKRTRPDIATAVAFLCTRVKEPDEHDWKKLVRVMKYLQLTPFIPLVLGWDKTGNIYWYVDASFAVHKDMRSHTGGMMTLGQGAVISMSTKQKLNTKSSTEAELVGVDDVMSIQVWSRYFIDDQMRQAGSETLKKHDVLYQDNTSAIRLEKNGKASSTKRTRHIDIRYYFITDRVKAGAIDIEYCPTDEMKADLFTKPLQGSKFREHRNSVQGISDRDYMLYKEQYLASKAKRANNDASRVAASE